MSRFMIRGGFLGFLIVFLDGLSDGRSIFVILRDGMIACLVMALLFRLFYSRLESSVVSVLEKESERMRQKAIEEAAEAEAQQADGRILVQQANEQSR